jgi:major membrane immunogen (membrane-anchored lipoprotein)
VTQSLLNLMRNSRAVLLAGVVVLAVALIGCGSSSSSSNTVSPAKYVKSVCGATATWFHTIESVGTKLKSTVKPQGPLSQTKAAYTSFVVGILHATQRAESQLKAAGTPSVKNGKQVADSLVRAFTSASRGLTTAAADANRIPTTSKNAFQSAGSRVQGEVQQAIASISTIAPQKNAQLRAAALKDPTCRQLKAVG